MGRSMNVKLWREWRERVRRFASSGMTVLAYCRQEQVSQAAFYQWRKKLGREETAAGASSHATPAARAHASGVAPEVVGPTVTEPEREQPRSAFVSVVPASLTGCAVLSLPNGVRVELPACDHELVARVVQAAAAASGGE